jgi:hydroxymethylbilane synthase
LRIRLATRKSRLALAQTRWVAERLRASVPGIELEEVHVVTRGDRIVDRPLADIGGKGLFVTEIENAVLQGRADLAVHSLKDLPAGLAEGLTLACVPAREDPRDVLVTREGCDLYELDAGDRVGTGSLRRRVQLRGLRNDLDYAPLRGNVDTRLGKLERGEYRAVVLAYAGLRRLGLDGRPLRAFPVEQVIPAVGQGCLALEARADDRETLAAAGSLEDDLARAAAGAERAFLGELGGDCNVPLGGHAVIDPGRALLRFDGMVGSVEEAREIRSSAECYLSDGREPMAVAAARLGREVARRLLAEGADRFIQAVRTGYDPRRAPTGE